MLQKDRSHPTMGAWIEINHPGCLSLKILGRTPRWVRGLKFSFYKQYRVFWAVAPHDGCVDWNIVALRILEWFTPSHPTMGAWIEIAINAYLLHPSTSHPTMGAWIEILQLVKAVHKSYSRTPRWVRGLKYKIYLSWLNKSKVAPHDGCVDWNLVGGVILQYVLASHPTMGAWIEINHIDYRYFWSLVAPHDGCVDWNLLRWIPLHYHIHVAPHDGCVDWNVGAMLNSAQLGRRTPRWVRGLKYWLRCHGR